MPLNIQHIAATFSGTETSYGELVQKYGVDVANAVKNIVAIGGGRLGSPASSGAASTGATSTSASGLSTVLGEIPIADDGDVITADYHNSLLAAVMALAGALADAQGAAQSGAHAFTWGNNSHLNTDQGGSIELGGDLGTAGTGTPYLDFHYQGATQDYNARIINDGDGQLSVYPTVANPPSETNVLAVHGERGIRQERLYLSGGSQSSTWSSISFNAHHYLDASGNVQWHFPDTDHPAVSIEMDAAPGHPRFQVKTTTSEQPDEWVSTPMLDINGDARTLSIGGVVVNADASEIKAGSAFVNGGTGEVGANMKIGVVDNSGTFKQWMDSSGLHGVTKNFVIDHPLHTDRQLVHSTLEGPEHSVFYRGEARLEHGRVTIQLPPYFESLCRPEGRSVQVTPKLERVDARPGVLGATGVHAGEFTVVGGVDTDPAQRFYWEVKAIRMDVDELEVEPLRSSRLDAAVGLA